MLRLTLRAVVVAIAVILLPLSIFDGEAAAHHGGGAGVGATDSDPALLAPAGAAGGVASRLRLDHQLLRVEETRSFAQPLAESATFFVQELGAAWAPQPRFELAFALPWMVRETASDTDVGVGDLALSLRLMVHRDEEQALFVGLESTLPTGAQGSGFGLGVAAGRAHGAYFTALGTGGWSLGGEAGFAWAYTAQSQLAFDYGLRLRSAPLPLLGGALRAVAAFSARSFLRDRATPIEVFPSQQRSAGDTTVLASPALAYQLPPHWLVLARTSVPLTRVKPFAYRVTLSLQYWWGAEAAG